MHRLRTVPFALIILILSAAAVFAAAPALTAGPQHNQAPAAAHSHAPDGSAEPSEKPGSSEAPEADGSAGPSHPANHGNDVSTAAKCATPSGFKNHGQWVSSIAKKNHGHDADPSASPFVCPAP
jgi:hypothetical protein